MLLRHDARPARGAASVELAVLLPFLMFVFVVAVDYARVFYFAVTVENCARNGAYYASEYPNSNYVYTDIYGYTDLSDAVLRDASNLKDAAHPEYNPTYTVGYSSSATGPFTGTTPTTNGYVKVTVSWTFRPVTRYPSIPSQVVLTRSVIMRMAPVMPTFPT